MKHKLNTDQMRDICKLQRVLNVDRTAPKMITLYCAKYKCTMYIKLLNALNKKNSIGKYSIRVDRKQCHLGVNRSNICDWTDCVEVFEPVIS